MKRLIIFFITLLIIGYPFIVYFSLNHLAPRYTALIFIFILSLRYILTASNTKTTAIPKGFHFAARRKRSRAASLPPCYMSSETSLQQRRRMKAKGYKNIILIAAIIGITFNFLGVISNNVFMIKLYPVTMNATMFSIFFYSLLNPPTIIEKIARIKTQNLPQAAIKYTRNVTIAWCFFFIINGLISLWTILFANIKIWTFYNGFLSYILVGVMFATEFIYRQFAKKKNYI